MRRRYTRADLEAAYVSSLVRIGVREFGLDFTAQDLDDKDALIDAILTEQG